MYSSSLTSNLPSKVISRACPSHILIHESTFEGINEDKSYKTGHSTSKQAAEIANKAKVKKLFLTHLSTRYKKSDLIKAEAEEIFENSEVAEDFMHVIIKRSTD